MKLSMKSVALGALFITGTGLGCGGNDNSGPLGNVDSLVILQRARRNDTGDIFQYASYMPGARLVKLSPPTADGTLTTLCCDKAGSEFSAIDISGYDISFDAKTIVFAGKLKSSDHYGLFVLTIADGSVAQIATDPMRDYVSPIFLPGDRVMFTTNAIVEAGAPQHMDEYERGTTIQLGRINIDGTHEELGPRNLSHRTAPSLTSDGRVIFTQWDHLGGENSGHLMFVDQDMQELREAFGKEGTGASNSTLKAMEISPGRFMGIATARNRTVNAGALIDIRLGQVSTADNGDVIASTAMSEANASYHNLSPDVPTDNSPSAESIGRYYDAFPLNAKEKPDLLVSWSDGPVESSVLAAAGSSANFGIYLYDSETQQRHPILDDPMMWDVFARPLQTRTAPPVVGSASDPSLMGQVLIGSMNVYNSSLHTFDRANNEVYGVRVMEGFSSEEGFPRMFGTTMFEGHAMLGVARVAPDGSWLATVPANVPIHLEAIDKFGMSLFPEPVWFSGRAGESRVCGGCHEDRAKTTTINPGITQAFAVGPTPMYGQTARADRMSVTDTSRDKVMGVAWDKSVQTVFDAHCIGCHGASNTAGIAPYMISDPVTGASVTWTFNLTGAMIPLTVGGTMIETYTASYFSIAGPDMEAIGKAKLVISGNPNTSYGMPLNAKQSILFASPTFGLNAVQQYPTQDVSKKAFAFTGHLAKHGQAEMTPDEYHLLQLAIDMGLNFYARENNPHTSAY